MVKPPPCIHTITGFFAAALVILACAEHFADGLVRTGEEAGVEPRPDRRDVFAGFRTCAA